jgi:hypothetical protein
MKLPLFAVHFLHKFALSIFDKRPPDFIIGENYLRRWFVIPRNAFCNVYLHEVNKSDDDRALHDHPWMNCSIVIHGGYHEHTIKAGGVEYTPWRGLGSVIFRRATQAHCLLVPPGGGAITFFITGPRIRQWGFHCPKAGWVHWQKFTSAFDSSKVGKGCDQ